MEIAWKFKFFSLIKIFSQTSFSPALNYGGIDQMLSNHIVR